jgi:hypothetical protein
VMFELPFGNPALGGGVFLCTAPLAAKGADRIHYVRLTRRPAADVNSEVHLISEDKPSKKRFVRLQNYFSAGWLSFVGCIRI